MKSLERKKFTTLELPLAAFLKTNQREIDLENHNGRQVFITDADDNLYRLLNDYNSNALVPITDYVAALKSLKQRLYAAKGAK